MSLIHSRYIWIVSGLPGSGKSTWVEKEFVPRLGHWEKAVVVSSDAYIEHWCEAERITYNQGFEKYIDKAGAFFHQDFQAAIKENRSVLVDRTNLTVKSRRSFLSQVPKHYKKVAVVFIVDDLVEHQRRLDSRPGKSIPEHVMEGMRERYQPPSHEEGFDSITRFYI